MNVQKYPVAPEAAAERMVLGRMVLRIEDSGMAVSEGMATYGEVSGKEAHPPAAPDENPFQSGDGTNGFYLSKSRLNRYIACPRSYLLHYDLGIVPLRLDRDLLIGRSTHRLIAAHHLARKKEEFVDANAVLDGVWSRYMQEDESPDTRQEMEAARTESLRYAQLFLRDVPLDPLEIERDFSLPLVDLENGDTLPVPLVGVIDLVDQPNGVLRPLEIKTRARKADAWQVRLALELTCYAW
ncbi:MAG TPA: PD-(D/E)XK nuclease family protein, partial [Syntrophales bacterium]|nr:PD-(D/E)XK nuclease family protein [Syntrophales bacterium]